MIKLAIAHIVCSILVLKDGQVVESGSFRELLAQNGLFATMWADQVSADDELSSVQKEAVSGYNVIESKPGEVERQREATDVAAPEPQDPFADPALVDFADDFIPTESPEPEKELAVGDEGVKAFGDVAAPELPPSTSEPIAFPSGQAVSFPASSSQPEVASPGVTFGAEVASPPSRSGTPDSEGKPKRIRKTSQNIQKFARTLSLAARRQSTGSSIVRAESPRASREESRPRREGSVGGDSTEASEDGKGKKGRKGSKGPKGKGTK